MHHLTVGIKCYRKESTMKKILSTIVAALAAISFAAIVSAADVPTTEPTGAAPAAEMGHTEGDAPAILRNFTMSSSR
jgi:hypothetical protein